MEGWKSYLKELYSTQVISNGVIADVDGGKNALTPDYVFNRHEVGRVHDILIQSNTDVSVVIQKDEFEIFENNGETAIGRSAAGSARTDIAMLGRTRKYLVILIADDDGSGYTILRKEMEWVMDHIKSEGY